jgi:hypothetical protein
MDELFWGQDHEDVKDWAKRLIVVVEVGDLNAYKIFKITKLNLRRWVKNGLGGCTQHQLIGLNYRI